MLDTDWLSGCDHVLKINRGGKKVVEAISIKYRMVLSRWFRGNFHSSKVSNYPNATVTFQLMQILPSGDAASDLGPLE